MIALKGITRGVLSVLAVVVSIASLNIYAQSTGPRGISGAWVPMGAGRGNVDPKIAPPPATPQVLKQPYAKTYEARRAADAEASKRGD